jgi:ribonuclease Z
LDKEMLMIDCGPATTYKLVKCGLFPTQIDHLLITHHHFDHTADYPCFLLCRWDQSTGSESLLSVWGPPPTESVTQRLVGPDGAFSQDQTARVESPTSQHVHKNRGGSLPRPRMSLKVTDVAPGDVIEGSGWRAKIAQTVHMQPWMESIAYRIETPGGTVVFAGDTEPCPGLTELADGADVLVVNCWDHQDTMEANGEAPGQTGTRLAGSMASQARAKKLVLTHIGRRLAAPFSREKAIRDIGRLYDGEVVFGEELMKLELW